jgi:hypothetical protein
MCPDAIQNYQSIINLNRFLDRTQGTYSPLLLKMSEQNSFWKDNPVLGDYLIQLLHTEYVPLVDAEAKIMLGNEYFQFKHPLEQGKAYSVGLWYLGLISTS